MRKLRELRLKAAGLSSRQVGASLGIGGTMVVDYLTRARRAGVAWPLPDDVTDEALKALLFTPPATRLAPIAPPMSETSVLKRLQSRSSLKTETASVHARTIRRILEVSAPACVRHCGPIYYRLGFGAEPAG